MITQTTLRRCDRCRRRLRGGTDWNVVVERGVITGLLCPDCQTPDENAEAVINEATTDYAVFAGRLVGRRKAFGNGS
jgi:hypothetical protein